MAQQTTERSVPPGSAVLLREASGRALGAGKRGARNSKTRGEPSLSCQSTSLHVSHDSDDGVGAAGNAAHYAQYHNQAMHHRPRPYRPLSPLTAPVRHSRIRRAAGSYVGTMYHPACTCRVGRADDRGAVLDEQMRVRGASRLRVADASAMPEIVGANTNATCIALGEKVADLVAREA